MSHLHVLVPHTPIYSYMCSLNPVVSVTENPSGFLAQWDQRWSRVQEVGVRFQLLTVEPNDKWGGRARPSSHLCGCALLAASVAPAADQHMSHTHSIESKQISTGHMGVAT